MRLPEVHHHANGTNSDAETVGYAALLGEEVTIASGDDGVHAESDLVVDAVTVTVSESVAGLEAPHILVTGGTVDVTSSDDGFAEVTLTKDAEAVLLASPDVTAGEEYTVQSDGSDVATVTAGAAPESTGMGARP